MMNQYRYSVKGMHCPSCEMIIEKKLIKLEDIKSVDASMSHHQVTLISEGDKRSLDELNRIFAGTDYTFMAEAVVPQTELLSDLAKPLVFAAMVIAVFFALSSSGLSSLVMITPKSTFSALFLFGLLAGISSCAALTGGLLLSLSSRWVAHYGEESSMVRKAMPHILFNVGRVGAYGLLGALLGFAGETIRISLFVASGAVIAVSFLMVTMALQMLGFTSFNRLNIALPKQLSQKIFGEQSANKVTHPLIAGIMTVLLPCGFTMVAEGAAMLSGNALTGMLIMLFFVLGTTPSLLAIGISSIQLSTNRKTSAMFTKTAALLIIFFVMYNLDVQFAISRNITGSGRTESLSAHAVAPVVAQNSPDETITTIYTSAKDISPSTFNVKAGQKIRLIVDSKDTGRGCMSTIMVPGLWDKPEPLVKGKAVIMEFLPKRAGAYTITCAMGVPRGVINVK